MIGPSVAVRSDPVRTVGLNIKRLRYLEPTKNRPGEDCPETRIFTGDSPGRLELSDSLHRVGFSWL